MYSGVIAHLPSPNTVHKGRHGPYSCHVHKKVLGTDLTLSTLFAYCLFPCSILQPAASVSYETVFQMRLLG